MEKTRKLKIVFKNGKSFTIPNADEKTQELFMREYVYATMETGVTVLMNTDDVLYTLLSK